MSQLHSSSAANQPRAPESLLLFRAANVTGSQEIPVEIGPGLSVRAVTDSIAHRMALPDDVAWQLRDDESSAYLDDDRSIGEQIAPGAHVTVTPKTHLGAPRVSDSHALSPGLIACAVNDLTADDGVLA